MNNLNRENAEWSPGRDMGQNEIVSPCSFCGLLEGVKDAGFQYCPNPLCESPGADWCKFYLSSYSASAHTWDAWELIEFVIPWLRIKSAQNQVSKNLFNKVINDLSKLLIELPY